MKILQFTTHLNIGGIARYVSALSRHLKQKGHSVLVASSGGDLEKDLNDMGIRHIYVDIKTKSELSPKLIKTFFTLKSFLKEEKIDVIHAHTRVAQVISEALYRVSGTPFVSTCHGFFKNRLGRRIYPSWGRRVIAISEAVRGDLITKFNVSSDKIDLVYSGIELDGFTKDITREKREAMKDKWHLAGSTVIGTIGRLSSVKGQDTLIRAFKMLIKDISNAKLILVGEGPEERSLLNLTGKLGLEDYVIFAPSIKDPIDALNLMDVFILPSVEEGLGLSLIEAMAAGVPCIASKIGGIENLIEDGINGILFRPGDVRGLAKAITFVLNNAEMAEGFRDKARRKVVEDFDVRDMVTRIEETYRKAAAGELKDAR